MHFDYLRERIRYLERCGSRLDRKCLQLELKELTIHNCEYLVSNVDVASLEERLSSRRRISFKEYQECLTNLHNDANTYASASLNGPKNDLKKSLEHSLDLIEVTEKELDALSDLEIGLRFGMSLDSDYRVIAASLPDDHSFFESVQRLLRRYLGTLKEATFQNLFENVQSQFGEYSNENPCLLYVDEIVPEDYFTSMEPNSKQDALAKYLTQLHPKLIWHLTLNEQQRYFPPPPLSVTHALCAQTDDSPLKLEPYEKTLVNNVAQMIDFADRYIPGHRIELARVLGIPPEGKLTQGIASNSAPFGNKKLKVGHHELLLAVHKLVHFTQSSILGARARVADLLHRFKQICELSTSSNAIKSAEKYWQRELAKFLIGHGIYATGTKLGKAETDHSLRVGIESFVIEDKAPGSINEKKIEEWITQLLCYLDSLPGNPKGVLLIVNRGKKLIVGPRCWLRNCIYIEVINLLPNPPSKTKTNCYIVPAYDASKWITLH